ncbi:MAG: insulinase family protein [Bacteroidetes bacterium]|nr:insulinase family protein [Bacteroidota bacterium]MBL7004005.1 insulinase family protein [Gammaproteobacteria bacterium]
MKYLLILLALFIANPSVYAKTVEYQLKNGMKLVVREDHRAPVVVSQVWYKIGATYEHDGISGVSHVLEHMMFKGTKNLKPGEFSEIIAENGGSENAFTSKDYTAYFQRISSDRLELCLSLEADRMRNLVFIEKEFKKEVEVVKEERRLRVDNKPKAKLFEQFHATAFLNSPQRIPTIGWMSDLDQLTMEDAEQWYQRWYAPNNAILVIVGDVKAEEVYALTQKYFADFKAMEIKQPKLRNEIKQTGVRSITLHDKVSSPYLIMGYKVPVLNTAIDKKVPFVLDVIGGILDGGSSARFSKHLLRGKEVAVEVGTSYDLYSRLGGLFLFAGTPTPKSNLDALQLAIEDQINELKQTPVSQQELERVIAQVIAGKIYDRDSMFNMGMQMGILESSGFEWQDLDKYEKEIKKVSIEDIQRVAKLYFNDDQLTLAKLLPKVQQGAE